MVIATDIACPACQRLKPNLVPWRKVGNAPFYICEECKNKTFPEDDLLGIGFFHGFKHALETVHSAVNGLRKISDPTLKEPLPVKLRGAEGTAHPTGIHLDSNAKPDGTPRPKIVCLCGSSRFYDAWQRAEYEETMAGRIYLSIGFYPHSVGQAHGEGIGHTDREKIALDELHKRKIDLCDEVFVLNVGGYIGDSTKSEIAYAYRIGKPVRWLEPEKAPTAPEKSTTVSLESLQNGLLRATGRIEGSTVSYHEGNNPRGLVEKALSDAASAHRIQKNTYDFTHIGLNEAAWAALR